MDDIIHTYTIQWKGPFASYEQLKESCKKGRKGTFAHPGLFSFYYFSGNKKWKRGRKFAYFGKHSKFDSITHRLNPKHEHFCQFHENENLEIWIGSFANTEYQTDEIIDFVETIFINSYKDKLNDNDKKTAKPFEDAVRESFVIVNLWYDINEKPYKSRSLVPFDDVITYEVDENRRLYGTLKKKKKGGL